MFDDSDHIELDKHVFNTEVSGIHLQIRKLTVARSGSYPPCILAHIPDSVLDIIKQFASAS